MTTGDTLSDAVNDIETELSERIGYYKREKRLLEAQRIEQRTMYDLEMLKEVGHCSGIEITAVTLTAATKGSHPGHCSTISPATISLSQTRAT